LTLDTSRHLAYSLIMSSELLIPWLQPSPLGQMLLVVRPSGQLVLLSWDTGGGELSRLAKRAAVRVGPLSRLALRPDGRLGTELLPPEAVAAATAVDDYLYGRQAQLRVAIDYLLCGSDFQRQVLAALGQVAVGTTTTYGALAAQLGRPPGAARAVGQAVGRNPIAIVVPCHRVVASDGSLGGFSGELWRKRQLLQLEGVAVPEGGWQVQRLAAGSAVAARLGTALFFEKAEDGPLVDV
jgi:methylated-DNA-[protein]-cysteine S-methyltransferase